MNLRLSPSELLDRVHHGGGNIVLGPDRSLQCENVPQHLASEVRRHAANGVLQAVLSGECFRPKPVPEPEKPVRKPSSRPRRTSCEVCLSGQGCRRRMFDRQPQTCRNCGHQCVSHVLPCVGLGGLVFGTGGCMRQVRGVDSQYRRCECPGWLAPEKKSQTKRRKKA